MDAHEWLALGNDLLAVVFSDGMSYTLVRLTGPEHEDQERSIRIKLLSLRNFQRCGLLGWCEGQMDATFEHDAVSLRAMRYACETFALEMVQKPAPPIACLGVTVEWLDALYTLADARAEEV